jgi:hypothetical protein
MNTISALRLLSDDSRLALLRAGGVTIGDGTIVKFGCTFTLRAWRPPPG